MSVMYEPTSQSSDEKSFSVHCWFSIKDSYSSAIPHTGGRLVFGSEHELAGTGCEMHASAGDHAGERGHRFLKTNAMTREMHISILN